MYDVLCIGYHSSYLQFHQKHNYAHRTVTVIAYRYGIYACFWYFPLQLTFIFSGNPFMVGRWYLVQLWFAHKHLYFPHASLLSMYVLFLPIRYSLPYCWFQQTLPLLYRNYRLQLNCGSWYGIAVYGNVLW